MTTMKKTILLLATLFYAFIAYGDSINFVKIYYNDSLLVQFQPTNDYYNIDINEATFKETDVIYVKYLHANGDDKTTFIYNVFNQNKQPLYDLVVRKNGAPISITKKYLASDFPLLKGNIYYFIVTSIVNMAELPPQRCFKITLK
jgi:hypothetical protein